jgi:HSP20 family protein
MEALRRDIDRAFSNMGIAEEPSFRSAFLPGRSARRYPLINLGEDRDNLYIEALAPGIDPATLDVSVIRNVLTISGEKRRVPEDITPEAFHRSERAAGKFIRNVELPVEVDTQGIKAEYKHGLLLLTLPKAAAAKPKQIAVQVV